MQGDVVFIPPITKTAGLAGEVTRPGIYELKQNETLADLIKFAGNLKPKADIFSATLHRIEPSSSGFNLIPIALNDSYLENFELNNGDVFNIYPVVDNFKNAVLIKGHALQPGFFPWQEGMRIGDLIKSKDNLLSMTDLTYVLVKREHKLNQNYEYIQIDFEEIFNNDAIATNILLRARDEILLLPSLLRPEQITTQLIADNYAIENDQVVLEQDLWSSMTYLRKSLMEEELSADQVGTGVPMINPATGMPFEGGLKLNTEFRRYYEYSIYDYCVIPEDLAFLVIETLGFRPKTKVPFEDLEGLDSQEALDDLLAEIGKEREKVRNLEATGQSLEITLTDICRRQLLEPVINVLERQRTPNRETRTVQVFGSVHFPGTYPLTSGMVLLDAIKAAGGLKSATYDSEIEISRMINSGKLFTVANTYASFSDLKAASKPLKAMDIINVKQISSGVRTVEITGEIYFSGVYPISQNQTLGELIRRAGGITEYGAAGADIFQRQSLKEAEIRRLGKAKSELRRKLLLTSQSAGLGQGEMDSAAVALLTTLLTQGGAEDEDALGRLVVDLEALLNGSVADVLLEDGDSIHIPATRQSVSVVGEVFAANSHLFKNDLTLQDYVDLSGGANDYADISNTYLIKADGSIISPSQLSAGGRFFRNSSNGKLQPGDTVVVPLEVQPFSAIKATTEITQIVYQMALAAAAVNSF
jgi:protein involved in polysaccharide export with SLBB domain